MAQDILNSVVAEYLTKHSGKIVSVKKTSSISGGCINDAGKIETNIGAFFVKWNNASMFPKMFETEAKGLKLLKQANCVNIPEVIGYGETDNISWIILEYIEPAAPGKNFWEEFAISLANQHRVQSEYYGLDYNNYIGSLPQYNEQKDNWIEFFISQRLEKQIKLARDKNIINTNIIKKFANLKHFLFEFFPKEEPSLLHGDLWGGNYMVNSKGQACIFDPAVYFGHRIMDIGMSKLFGGFPAEFYDAYNNEYPLGKSWESSIPIANLYPLMVHVNLFGGSYLNSVERILKPF